MRARVVDERKAIIIFVRLHLPSVCLAGQNKLVSSGGPGTVDEHFLGRLDRGSQQED
jgi:hypothetical protein